MGPCLIVCGVFWITMAFISKTKDFISTLLYQAIPFITGVITASIGLDLTGVIQLLN